MQLSVNTNVGSSHASDATANTNSINAHIKTEQTSPQMDYTNGTTTALPAGPASNAMSNSKTVINTRAPTNPPIQIITSESGILMCVPNVTVPYVGGDGSPETGKVYQLQRRVDTGYVNATILLMAGGLETESERSIILSLEVGRIKVRKTTSDLYGTW